MWWLWITSKDECDDEDGQSKTHHVDVHSFFNSDDKDADNADDKDVADVGDATAA